VCVFFFSEVFPAFPHRFDNLFLTFWPFFPPALLPLSFFLLILSSATSPSFFYSSRCANCQALVPSSMNFSAAVIPMSTLRVLAAGIFPVGGGDFSLFSYPPTRTPCRLQETFRPLDGLIFSPLRSVTPRCHCLKSVSQRFLFLPAFSTVVLPFPEPATLFRVYRLSASLIPRFGQPFPNLSFLVLISSSLG